MVKSLGPTAGASGAHTVVLCTSAREMYAKGHRPLAISIISPTISWSDTDDPDLRSNARRRSSQKQVAKLECTEEYLLVQDDGKKCMI